MEVIRGNMVEQTGITKLSKPKLLLKNQIIINSTQVISSNMWF